MRLSHINLNFVTAVSCLVRETLFAYDSQISCPRVCNWTCHGLRCASSITHPERIAHRITFTGGESRIAFTRRFANGFAQSKTDSQSEG
jgi:hypothetical protein